MHTQIEDEERLEIFTLGRFLVRRGDKVLTADTMGAKKPWNVFKYLLAQDGDLVSSDILVDILWPNEPPVNPQHALQNLVYRLRRLLKYSNLSQNHMEYICSQNGYYGFNTASNYWVDADEFEDLCMKASTIGDKNPNEAINTFKQALSYYRGDYLCENTYDDWINPLQNHYRRIYVESLTKLINLLKQAGRFFEVKELCERPFIFDTLEEDIHISFMEVLASENKISQVKDHYKYACSLINRKTGLPPSSKMEEAYKEIVSKPRDEREYEKKSEMKPPNYTRPEKLNRHTSLFSVPSQKGIDKSKIKVPDGKGNAEAIIPVLLALTSTNDSTPMESEIEQGIRVLMEVLIKNIRHRDVVWQVTKSQLLVVLYDVDYTIADKVFERIQNDYCERWDGRGIVLQKVDNHLHTMAK